MWCLCTIDYNPRRWGCAQEGKKSVRQVCLLNKHPPFLLANQYIISQPLLSQPQPAPHKNETEVANPQYLLHWQHLIPQNQIAAEFVPRSGRKNSAARASQPWYKALNLSGEGRDKAVPVSTSADRSICEPQDCSLRCASAAAGPEPWGTRA